MVVATTTAFPGDSVMVAVSSQRAVLGTEFAATPTYDAMRAGLRRTIRVDGAIGRAVSVLAIGTRGTNRVVNALVWRVAQAQTA